MAEVTINMAKITIKLDRIAELILKGRSSNGHES
jgi:hypothetical protein